MQTSMIWDWNLQQLFKVAIVDFTLTAIRIAIKCIIAFAAVFSFLSESLIYKMGIETA